MASAKSPKAKPKFRPGKLMLHKCSSLASAPAYMSPTATMVNFVLLMSPRSSARRTFSFPNANPKPRSGNDDELRRQHSVEERLEPDHGRHDDTPEKVFEGVDRAVEPEAKATKNR